MPVRCPGKLAWPELVGEDGRAAAATIEKENPYVRAFVMPTLSPVPRDRCDRVWVLVGPTGRVREVPVVG